MPVLCCTLTALGMFSLSHAPLGVLLHTHPHLCTLTQHCTPAHTCTHSQSFAYLCACSCTTLHTHSMLPQPCTPVHTLTHLYMFLHIRAHTLMCPAHLCMLSHSVAHLYTQLHTCAYSHTSLHVLPQPCTLFQSLNVLTALHTCAFLPAVHTLTPLCPLAQPRCCRTHPARRSLLLFSHVPHALAQPWAPLHAPHVLAHSHPSFPGGHSSWGYPMAPHPSLGSLLCPPRLAPFPPPGGPC